LDHRSFNVTEEYTGMWSRRAFLKAGGLALFSASVGGIPPFVRRTALGGSEGLMRGDRQVLVVIFQRGAMDGLMAVSPRDDPYLRRHRPALIMQTTGVDREGGMLALDERYGLHPAFGQLLPLYRDGQLAIVHGVGSPDKTRSHFDAQDYMETGTPGKKGTRSGWLNRAAGMLGHEGTPFRAVSMTSSLPRSFYGDQPVVALVDLDRFGLTEGKKAGRASYLAQGFQTLYERSDNRLLREAGQEAFEAVQLLSRANTRSYKPAAAAVYPDTVFGKSLREVAQLIKSDVGLEVAFVEIGGWDTHAQQGTTSGTFARRAGELAGGISAFWTDLGDDRDRVVLMTMTEFGRTVRENGSGGTDHGRASCLFVLGGEVRGGVIHGSAPALHEDELEDGRDLPVTTDFRSVFAEVAIRHLRLVGNESLFPGWGGDRLTLFRA
jgi:uncharacterized protein (DUF1501 family)